MKKPSIWPRNVAPVLVALTLATLACSLGGASQDEPAPPPVSSSEEEPAPPPVEPDTASEPVDLNADASTDIPEFEVPIEGFDHITVGTSAQYDHYPPSSGEHYSQQGVAPIEWALYTDTIPPEVWVHNLEHSGIVVLYNCLEGCPELEDQLLAWGQTAPESKWGNVKLLISPDSRIDSLLVALAWGWQLDLEEFDADALTEFYMRHVDQGPEDLP